IDESRDCTSCCRFMRPQVDFPFAREGLAMSMSRKDQLDTTIAGATPVSVQPLAPRPSIAPTLPTPVVPTQRARSSTTALLHLWDADRAALAVIGAALVVALVLVALVLSVTARGGSAAQPPNSPGGMPRMSGMSTTPLGKAAPARMPAQPTYNAQLPPLPGGNVVNVHLIAKEALLAIAPGEAYQAWTFDGTVPGPIIRVRQGQTIHFTLTNADTHMAHSIDF